MASTRRTANHSVKERLRKEPYRFSFVQAVRMLEQIGSLQPLARLPVGNNALPGCECVHFASVA